RKGGGKVVLLAHFGRPKGKPNSKYSLKPVADHLGELLGTTVGFSPEVVGSSTEAATKVLAEGGVLLIENVRFFEGEEANDPEFAKQLGRLGDVYVNDAFGAAHRAHASTAGVAHFLQPAAMGLLMERELKYLQDELATPAHPFLVILGGAKVSDKIGVIKALMEKADVFLIGGAMAYTFYRALGIPTGASRVEEDKVHLAQEILSLAEKKGIKFLFPVDNIETDEFRAGANSRNTPVLTEEKGITDGWQAVDIGKETIRLYRAEIAKAKTILWNGPVGVFEIPDFANGTRQLAIALAESGAKTIIGGGDSVTAVNQFGLTDKMTFISTGGGASLELLEGKTLPGVAALTDK
ncbi:MAG TPA: phosphoglycerate kinase, partial [Chthoniobacterales bacterium]|nr:phosphoglycerate kinase [Chthoniobacterales bacterium]